MSKSKNNVIPLFGTDKEWKKAIMSIQTDSLGLEDKKDPDSCNVFSIYKLFASKEEEQDMREKYLAGGYGYGHAKLALLEKMKERFSEKRDRYFDLIKRKDDVVDILKKGSNTAREKMRDKLDKIKTIMGFLK